MLRAIGFSEIPVRKIKIKICGLKDAADFVAASKLNPDYVGIIFFPASLRFAGESLQSENLSILPTRTHRVGVFVDAEIEEIIDRVKTYSLNAVQLHGVETPHYCRRLKNRLTNISIIKSFAISDTFCFHDLHHYEKCTDYYHFDSPTHTHGGSGKRFNWTALANYKEKKPFFLSGGIGLEILPEVIKLKQALPMLDAIDVNSRFEVSPGIKDFDLLTKLFTYEEL